MAELDELVSNIKESAKYRYICEDFIRRIGAKELQHRKNVKEAIKATKNKLHQTAGAYFESSVNFPKILDTLKSADDLKTACRKTMGLHASTAERLPILDEFYAKTLADIAPITSILDLACGLNPLAAGWMPLAPNATYYAYDLYEDMMAFLQEFLVMQSINGIARPADIGQFIPAESVQLALILKTLPCLEQVDKSISLNLLERIQAEHLLVSFPSKSLGGKNKGMVANYESHLYDLIEGKNWGVRRFEFSTELAFLITK